MARAQWKLLTLLFAVLQLLFLEVLVNAAAVPSEPENQGLEKRQSTGDIFPVLGASGGCSQRMSIEDMFTKDKDQFNMLVLALEDLQKRPGPDIDLGWWGIGRIHGGLYGPWKQPPSEGPFNTRLGYCVHGSPLFSLWHRPYVLLLEQLLQERALEIATQFKDGDGKKYWSFAIRLRLPYFDWSDPAYGGRIPTVLTTRRIEVFRPPPTVGMPLREMMDNPFYRYNFHVPQEINRLPYPFSVYRYTTRNPNGVQPNPVNGDGAINTAMMNSFTSRRQNTFNLFTRTTFNAFSNQCEIIHNGIHNTIGAGTNGGRGHMASPAAAAYDPIFWLHHSNIDRLIAMYQVIYPNNLLTPAPATETFCRVRRGGPVPSMDTLETRLCPFRKQDGSFYTGSDFTSGSVGIWKYNYSYPEIPCQGSGLPLRDLSQDVRMAINKLYMPVGGTPLRRRQNETLPEPTPEETIGYAPPASEVGLVRTEYSLRLYIDLAEIKEPWVCHIFLGKVPDRTADYLTSPSRCGVFAPFITQGGTNMSMPYTFDFALTDKLLELGVSSDETEAYLKKDLTYVIVRQNGRKVDINKLKTFKAGVCTFEGTYGKVDSDNLASLAGCTVLSEVMEEKPGGVTTEEEINEITLVDGTTELLNTTMEQY